MSFSSQFYSQNKNHQIIHKNSFSQDQTQQLIQKVSNQSKVIIRVYGLAGVGKGTISSQLSSILNIPNLESSLILRALTYVYETKKLDFSLANSQQIFRDLTIQSDQESFQLFYQNQVLERAQLKSSLVDSKITNYSSSLNVRELFYQSMGEFLSGFQRVAILDGRGINIPYLETAKKNGFQIIWLLVDCSDEVKWLRYKEQNLQKQRQNGGSDSQDFQNSKMENQLKKDFQINILERNRVDVQTWKNLNMGLIADGSGILDNSQMNITEMVESTLCFLDQKL